MGHSIYSFMLEVSEMIEKLQDDNSASYVEIVGALDVLKNGVHRVTEKNSE